MARRDRPTTLSQRLFSPRLSRQVSPTLIAADNNDQGTWLWCADHQHRLWRRSPGDYHRPGHEKWADQDAEGDPFWPKEPVSNSTHHEGQVSLFSSSPMLWGSFVGCLLGCLVACLLACLLGCLVARLLVCLVAWLLGCLVARLLGCSVARLLGCLVTWLLGCLVA